MDRLLKTCLLWLLIVALPVQGMAAVVKASCGPAHHASLPAASMPMPQHHHQAGESAAHHHHHGLAGMDHHHDASTITADASPDADHVNKSSFCSACAACCFGAAAPPTALSWAPAHASSEAAVLPLSVLSTGYIPGGLERPPRHLSA